MLCSEQPRVSGKHSISRQTGDRQCERLCDVIAQQQPGFRRDRVQATELESSRSTIVHLMSSSGLRMKRGLELTALGAATVVLQGCTSIVHAEVAVTGSTAAVRVSLEMIITVVWVCLGLWLVARSGVGQECTPKENTDKETKFRLQQGTPCGNGDTWMLAMCTPVEVTRWDRGLSLWQAAKWVVALDDTDMFDKDVVAGNGNHSDCGTVQSTVDALYGTI